MTNSNIESQVQPATNAIITVQEYDVLMGRGKLYVKHVGNQNFLRTVKQWTNVLSYIYVQCAITQISQCQCLFSYRNAIGLIKENTDRYFEVISSIEKFNISMAIVDTIQQSNGRFIRQDGDVWRTVDRSIARKKVAYALQHQRREALKRMKNLPSLYEAEFPESFVVPPPPPLRRQAPYVPSNDNYVSVPTTKYGLNGDMKLSSDSSHKLQYTYCRVKPLIKQKQSTGNEVARVTPSQLDHSTVQVAADQIIARCGTPLQPSLSINYLDRFIENYLNDSIHNNVRCSNAFTMSNDEIVSTLQHQQQENEPMKSKTITRSSSTLSFEISEFHPESDGYETDFSNNYDATNYDVTLSSLSF
jgi:hypothetical protein